MSATAVTARSLLASLPEELAPWVTTAAEASRRRGSPGALLPTAPPLGSLLGGGLPRGELVEVVGTASSGRFSLALAALAAVTSTGEAAALVDTGGQLDPQEARSAGVDLARLLWVRPDRPREALSAAETVTATGFPLVVLELGLDRGRARSLTREAAAWLRLCRTARARDVALLVLAPCRVSGAAAAALLSAARRGAAWKVDRPGQTPLLAALASSLTLEKRRGLRPGAVEVLRLCMFPGEPARLRVPPDPLRSQGLGNTRSPALVPGEPGGLRARRGWDPAEADPLRSRALGGPAPRLKALA